MLRISMQTRFQMLQILKDYAGKPFDGYDRLVAYLKRDHGVIVSVSTVRSTIKAAGLDATKLITNNVAGQHSPVAVAHNRINAMEERIAALEARLDAAGV